MIAEVLNNSETVWPSECRILKMFRKGRNFRNVRMAGVVADILTFLNNLEFWLFCVLKGRWFQN